MLGGRDFGMQQGRGDVRLCSPSRAAVGSAGVCGGGRMVRGRERARVLCGLEQVPGWRGGVRGIQGQWAVRSRGRGVGAGTGSRGDVWEGHVTQYVISSRYGKLGGRVRAVAPERPIGEAIEVVDGRRVRDLTAEEHAELRAYWEGLGLSKGRLDRVLGKAKNSTLWRDTEELDRRLAAFHALVPSLKFSDVVSMIGSAPNMMDYNTGKLQLQVETLRKYFIDEGARGEQGFETGEDLGIFLRKAPHIIALSIPNLESKIAAMREALPTANVSRMIKTQPHILYLNIECLRQKMKDLREIFPEGVDIDKLIESSPQLLKSDVEKTVARKLNYLQSVLPDETMRRLYNKPPSLSTAMTLSITRLERLGRLAERDPEFLNRRSPMTILCMSDATWNAFWKTQFNEEAPPPTQHDS